MDASERSDPLNQVFPKVIIKKREKKNAHLWGGEVSPLKFFIYAIFFAAEKIKVASIVNSHMNYVVSKFHINLDFFY